MPESQSLPLEEAMRTAALELTRRDAAAGGVGVHLGQLAELLERQIARASRPPRVCFSSGTQWDTDLALWGRLADGARALLEAQGRSPAFISRHGTSFRRLNRGTVFTRTAQALLVSARGLLAGGQVSGDDAGHLLSWSACRKPRSLSARALALRPVAISPRRPAARAALALARIGVIREAPSMSWTR
jgi:hypothetical protein